VNTDYRRKFGIADGLILIAGIGAGMGLFKAMYPDVTVGALWNVIFQRQGQTLSLHLFMVILELGIGVGIPLAAGWTPACLLVQLVKPRGPWRRLRRQPGVIACLIVSPIIALTPAIALALDQFSIWNPYPTSAQLNTRAGVLSTVLAATGVLWAWISTRLSAF
jgi:hypothetical protein